MNFLLKSLFLTPTADSVRIYRQIGQYAAIMAIIGGAARLITGVQHHLAPWYFGLMLLWGTIAYVFSVLVRVVLTQIIKSRVSNG